LAAAAFFFCQYKKDREIRNPDFRSASYHRIAKAFITLEPLPIFR
jgi:hypothetical protein